MIDEQTAGILRAIIRREICSFAHYVRDSLPWPSPDGAQVQHVLGPLFEQEYDALGRVYQMLTRHRLPLPHGGSYPSAFTTRNFISLHGLLPFLIDDERKLIDALERDLRAIHDPESHRIVSQLLEVKQSNLSRLKQMFVSPPAVAAAS